MIGYIVQLANPYDESRNHEWVEHGPDKYISLCGPRIQPRQNVAEAAEVTCTWCLKRRQNLEFNSRHNSGA